VTKSDKIYGKKTKTDRVFQETEKDESDSLVALHSNSHIVTGFLRVLSALLHFMFF